MKQRIIAVLPAIIIDEDGNAIRINDEQLELIATEILIVISQVLKEEYNRGYNDGKTNNWQD